MSEAESTVLSPLAATGAELALVPEALHGREDLVAILRSRTEVQGTSFWQLGMCDVLQQLELMEALAVGLGGTLWATRCVGASGWGGPLHDWLTEAGVPGMETDSLADGLLFELRDFGRAALFALLDATVAGALARGPLVLALADAARCDGLTFEWLSRLSQREAPGALVVLLGGLGVPEGLPLAGHLADAVWSPALATDLATRLGASAGGGALDDAWLRASTGRLALRRWVAQRVAGAARPDDAVRELMRAVAMTGGWVRTEGLASIMDMPPDAFGQLRDRAVAGGWLLPFARGVGLTSDAEVVVMLGEMAEPETTRWNRRLASAGALPPLTRLQAAVAGGAEGLTVPLGLRAARQLLPVGGAHIWLAGVREALDVPGFSEEGASRLWLGVALLSMAAGQTSERLPLDVPEAGWLAARVARLDGGLAKARALLETEVDGPAMAWLRGRELAMLDEAEGHSEAASARLRELAALPTPSGIAGECMRTLIEGDLARLSLAEHETFSAHAGPAALALTHPLRLMGQHAAAEMLCRALATWATHHERWALADDALVELPASPDHVWVLLRAGAYQRALLRLEEVPVGGELEPVCMALAAVCQLFLGLAGDLGTRLDAAVTAAAERDDALWHSRLTGLALDVALHLGRFRLLCFVPADYQATSPWERLVRAEAAVRLGELDLAERWLAADEPPDTSWRFPVVGARRALVCALLAQARGDLDGAVARLAEAEALSAADGPAGLLDVTLRRGELHLACGEAELALAAFADALRLAEDLGGPLAQALAFGGLARAASDMESREAFGAQAEALLGVMLAPLSAHERSEFLAWRERAEALRVVRPERDEAEPAWVQAASLDVAAEQLLELLAAEPTPEEVGAHIAEALRHSWGCGRVEVHIGPSMCGPLAERGEPLSHGAALDREDVLTSLLAAARSERRVLVADGSAAWRGVEALLEPRATWHLVALPLSTSVGGDVAVAVLESSEGTPVALHGLEAFLQRAGLVLFRALRDAEAGQRSARSSLLTQLHHALAGTLDVEALLKRALAQVLTIFRGEQAFVFFGADQACRGSLDRAGGSPDPAHTSRTVRSRVMAERRPVTILDVGQDHEAVASQSLMLRNVRSVMCVPLVLADDLLGMLYVSSSTANKTFTREDLEVLNAIASHLALLLQNAQAFETIRELNQGLEAKVQARTQELESAVMALRDTQAQLLETEKLATVGTLAAGVAHEINNPLGAVLLNAQLLRQELHAADQLESVELIERGARRCQEIVQALLAYARPTPVERQALDLGGLVREALDALSLHSRVAAVNLAVEVAPVPLVVGDAGELRHLLNQLVLNALDAVESLPEGAAALHVRLYEADDGVVLEVADNGVGMTPEVARRVFDPFFTTKAVGSGKGLGLSLCRRIVDKHGGNIIVTSEVGRGAQVRVVLPKG